MYSRVIVQPPVEPLTLDEVKVDRSVDHNLHDAILTSLITAARQYVEKYCESSLVTQTREAGYDDFCSTVLLPYGPVQEVISLEYVATDGSATPITDYQADLYGGTPQLRPAFGTMWPYLGASLNAVKVRYVAGYPALEASPTDYVANVPEAIKTAMRLLVGNWYENREASVTGTINTTLSLGVAALLDGYKLRTSLA